MNVNATTTAHDPVNHPSHYTSHPSGIECIEVTRQLSFDIGNAVKYVLRRGDKGSARQDLDKALFYLRDARKHPAQSLRMPPKAAATLHRAALADPDPTAANFYRAAAEMRWAEAETAVEQLKSQLPRTSAE